MFDLGLWWVRQWVLLAAFAVVQPGTANALSPDQDLKQHATSPVTVIFVHGVMGDPVTTFGPSATRNWPAMLAGDTVSAGGPVRVMSVGYPSGPLGRASNITEIATRLKSKLIDRQVFDNRRKVVFVAHSMGGLVVKRMLVQLAAESPDAFRTVAGVFFLATPSGGSDLASVASWISSNPQFRDMKPEDFNTFLQVIEDDWQSLLRRRSPTRPYPRVYCAYEKIGIGPGKVVVPRSRAQSGCDETPIAYDVDHFGIAKPASTTDEVYEFVAHRIARIYRDEGIPMEVRTSLVDPSGTPLAEPFILRSGDGYVLKVTLSKPGWIYVFAQDSTGRIERYFPGTAAGNQVSPQESFRIPQQEPKVFRLDNNRGVDRLFVVATSERSEQLTKLHSEIQNAKSKQEAARTLEQALVKRGAVVADAASSPAARPPLTRLTAGSLPAEGVASIVIEHR